MKEKLLNFWKQYRYLWIAYFVFAILIFGYFGTHTILNLDGVNDFPMNNMAQGFHINISMGRWAWALMCSLFGYMPVPFVLLIMNAIFLSLAAFFFTELLGIKSHLLKFLVGMIIIGFPYGINAYAYLQWQFSYGIGIFFAIYAAYRLKIAKKWTDYLLAFSLITFCFGIYQTFVTIVAALLLLLTIIDLKETTKWNDFMKKTLYRLGMIVGCCLAYYLITQACLWIFDVSLSNYQGASSMFSFDLSLIFNNFSYIASKTVLYLKQEAFFPLFAKIVFILSTLASIVLVIIKGKKRYLPFFLILFTFFILSPRLLEFVKPYNNNHEITLLAYMIVMGGGVGLVIQFCEEKFSHSLLNVKQLACLFLIPTAFFLVLNANKAAVLSDLTDRASLSFVNRLQARVEQLEGYSDLPDPKKYYFVGFYGLGEFPYNKDLFPISVGINYSYVFCYQDFVDAIRMLGIDATMAIHEMEAEDSKALLKEAQNRPNYPDKDSIFLYKDIIVVKLVDFDITKKDPTIIDWVK